VLHHAKVVGAATVLASGAAAVINEWVTVGAGVATILGAGIALYSLRRRKRIMPKPPHAPALGSTKREWELYGARMEQFYKDQEGQEDG
jgi:O-antigen/teichoic acid export membrane protein